MTEHDMLTSDHPSAKPSRAAHHWWIGVAALSVGVVVAGTTGYAFGRTGDTHQTAAPAISWSASASAGTQLGRPAMTGAQEPSADHRMGVDVMPYGYGRVVFTSSGLSDSPDSLTAWAFDPGQVFSRQTAVDAAAVLGLDAEPRLVDGVWTVGPNDGSGPTLQLAPDGLASLSFWDPTLDPYGCAFAVAEDDQPGDSGSGSSGGSGGSVDPVPAPAPDCGPKGPDAPSGDAAIDVVKDVLTSLGIDVSSMEFEVGDYGTPHAAYVAAFPVVDGQRTDALWSVTLVGRQIQALYGGLAPAVALGSYDVVSPVQAVDRLSDPRYGLGFFGGPMPMGIAEAGDRPVSTLSGGGSSPDGAAMGMASPKLPPTVRAGDDFGWPVQQVTITRARLGLALYTQPDGSAVLIPVYVLTDTDGMQRTVVAVDDQSLDFSA
jgi:hypothetical protein